LRESAEFSERGKREGKGQPSAPVEGRSVTQGVWKRTKSLGSVGKGLSDVLDLEHRGSLDVEPVWKEKRPDTKERRRATDRQGYRMSADHPVCNGKGKG
jgi:hypothetical protein